VSPRQTPIGVVFPADAEVAELPAFVARAETAGIDELWLIEDCFLSGGLTMAATALALSERLRVGIGLMPAPLRNPALAAMEIATLANLAPGRLAVAVGHGVAEWMRQVDALPARRLAALEEVVVAIRSLLGGAELSTDGDHVRLDRVVLDRPPAVAPPVLVGTTGPRGLALAGRVADGVLLPEGSGPAFVEWALEQAAAAEREPAFDCTVYAWLRIEDDAASAQAALAPVLTDWLGNGLFPHAYELAGAEPGAEPDPELLVPRVAVAGDPAECAAALAALAEAGASRVVLSPLAPDRERQLARLTAEVLPAFRALPAAAPR
jgi:5,10-methylenetetrahydromethanopterin reductase